LGKKSWQNIGVYKVKYLIYILNIIKSFFYDIYYYIFENLSIRKGAYNYDIYKSTKYYADYIKHGAAVDGVKYLAQKYCQGKGVDIGAGNWSLNGVKAIENNENENAYKILEDDNSLDFVFSSHLLEHLDKPYEAIEHWTNKLKSGGVLFFYLPHPACHMWQKENLKYHLWNPNPYELEKKFSNDDRFDIEYITYLPDGYMSFAIVLRKK
jgi:SAM-dependent methyltransferase